MGNTIKYTEMINVIANTCLLFCDRESMTSHIGFNMNSNNASSMKPFMQKATFCELSNEVYDWYNGDVDLETLLDDYKEASEIFDSYFKRSYSINLHKDNFENDADAIKKRQQIIKILNFFYSDDSQTAEEIAFLNNEKKKIQLHIIKEKETQFHAIFILLMIGLIPTYSSKKGAATQLLADFHELMFFLREYGRQASISDSIRESPILTRFETWVKENDESNLRRIDLIKMTKDFADVIIGFSSPENTFHINQQLNRLYPDLEGFWSESKTLGSQFWKFEELSNGYNLYKYNLVNSTEGKRLEYTKYECTIFGNDINESTCYIYHPSMMRKLVEYAPIDYLHEWDDVEIFEKDGIITQISFHPAIRLSSAMLPSTLYRIKDEKKYQEWLVDNQVEQINSFADDEYILILNQFAITRDHLYVKLDEVDIDLLNLTNTTSTLYLKVPKALDPSLDLLTLKDEWSICKFYNGDCYFTVTNSMLYFKINSESERAELGIEIVDRIG